MSTPKPSKDWCKGFCRTCGTGCGQYCEEIFQLRADNMQLAKQLQVSQNVYDRLAERCRELEYRWEQGELTAKFSNIEFLKMDKRVRELEAALQTAVGHSNCYCKECEELTKYWSPSKALAKLKE